MPDIIVDARTAVWWLTTITSPTLAPTVAELAAGHRISRWAIPQGLEGWDTQQAEVDNTGLENSADTKLPGRKSYSGSGIVLKEQTVPDTAWTAAITAMAENTDGFIVIRDRILATTTPVAGDKVEVYTCRAGEHALIGRGEANSLLRRRIPTPVSGLVNKNALVLA